MQQHHGAVTVRERPVDGLVLDLGAGPPRLPVVELDVPVDVSVSELRQQRQHAGVVVTRAERAPEPGPRVAPRRLDDVLGPLDDVGADAVVGEQRHPGVEL